MASTEISQTEIARELDVSVVTVHHWIQCVKRPSPKRRELIAEVSERWPCGRIEPAAWDDFPPPRSSATVMVAEKRGDEPQTLAAHLDELERQASRLSKAIDPKTSAEKRIRSLAHLTRVLSEITKIRSLERRSFRENPMWRIYLDALTEALGPFPEAARAVRERFARLDAEGR